MIIRKALIAAAGYGSRMLPVTKAVQKEMLPVLNRPVIDYIVEDCLKAGINEFVIVANSSDSQMRSFYEEDEKLNTYLRTFNKLDILEQMSRLHSNAHFSYVVQTPQDPYGTTTPLKLAKEHLENEDAFLVFMGDDFIFNQDGTSEAKLMIDLFSKNSAVGLATFLPVSKENVSRYGVAKYTEVDGTKHLDSIVEKPSVEDAPSNLINISKYIFTPLVFDIIKRQKIEPRLNELLITDTVSELVKEGGVLLFETTGEYFDCGNLESWLQTNIAIAMKDPVLREVVQKTVNKYS